MKIRDCVAKAVLLVNRNTEINNIEISGSIMNSRQCANIGKNGMTYLTISDGDSATDKIDSVIYTINDKLVDNTIIKCRGCIQIYVSQRDSRKSLQFRIISYEICGVSGDSMYIKLKQRLQTDGIIDTPRKHIPQHPKIIGLIGGVKNDGTFDVLNKLNMYCSCQVYIYDTVLTPTCIMERIEYANLQNTCDVLLIVRGGGSKEDLATLNDYDLAICVKNSRIPIISGIGHTLDHTIIDDVSDMSCETPTATAYYIIDKYAIYDTQITSMIGQFNNLVEKTSSSISVAYDMLRAIEDAYQLTTVRFLNRYNILITNVYSYIHTINDTLAKEMLSNLVQLTDDVKYKCKLYKSVVKNTYDDINENHWKITLANNDTVIYYEKQVSDMFNKLLALETVNNRELSMLNTEISTFSPKVCSNGEPLISGYGLKKDDILTIEFIDKSCVQVVCI